MISLLLPVYSSSLPFIIKVQLRIGFFIKQQQNNHCHTFIMKISGGELTALPFIQLYITKYGGGLNSYLTKDIINTCIRTIEESEEVRIKKLRTEQVHVHVRSQKCHEVRFAFCRNPQQNKTLIALTCRPMCK